MINTRGIGLNRWAGERRESGERGGKNIIKHLFKGRIASRKKN
jgi:hypothetical protein